MNPSRPVRIANCSGYKYDPAWQMLRQVQLGHVDFVTGDYLAEMNLAEDAEAFREGKNNGWAENALTGIEMSIDELAKKGTKVVINGGALNPAGLAQRVLELVKSRNLELKVAYVTGDDLLSVLGPDLASLGNKLPPHLDSANAGVTVPAESLGFKAHESVPLVSANAYLGARAIVAGLRAGADIIICGRVSDASPAIGAAWYWHDWSDTDYDQLAGGLIAGHLIECSAYVTGGNFSGFTEYDMEEFLEPGFPIAEIDRDGACVITKHSETQGMVNEDTVRCQLLYELQGNIYLHSDVKAYLDNVTVKSIAKDRVAVRGIKGGPPPATTKAAIFYRGGYQAQLVVNATGYGTHKKWRLFETQVRRRLRATGHEDDIALLDFQIVGVPEVDPKTQLRSTTYCRVFVEALTEPPVHALLEAFTDVALQHFSGFHSSLDMRTAIPRPFLAYYPALYAQEDLQESVTLLNQNFRAAQGDEEINGIKQGSGSSGVTVIEAGHPPNYEPLENRESYNTQRPYPIPSLGATRPVPLGDVVLARSGDKGSNLNCGLFVKRPAMWNWFKTFLSHERMVQFLGDDWKEWYFMERIELPNIYAVHFVIYGILGRGVSGSSRLDCLGKGFADYIRDKVVDVPEVLLH